MDAVILSTKSRLHINDFFVNNIQNDEGVSTFSSVEQDTVEEDCAEKYEYVQRQLKLKLLNIDDLLIRREVHCRFLTDGLSHLDRHFQSLDTSQPWLMYWIVHALNLLHHNLSDEMKSAIIFRVNGCQCAVGGYSGGPGQDPHLASTYAAVNLLMSLGTEEAYDSINRISLKAFLKRMHQPDGSFIMHEGGETDIRGAYCAASAAVLTNISVSDLFPGTVEWLRRCQTHEGGFGAEPGCEAHGGYTFCGIAALMLLGKEHLWDPVKALRWVVNRQTTCEGGFNGRTHKLVDACYSFWQTGAIALLLSVLRSMGKYSECCPIDSSAVQEYIIICCQARRGGIIDKPGKYPDFYHTCYGLSGVSVAQRFGSLNLSSLTVFGGESNLLEETDNLHNILTCYVKKATAYYNHVL